MMNDWPGGCVEVGEGDPVTTLSAAPLNPLRFDLALQSYAREHIVAGGGSRNRQRRFAYVAASALEIIGPETPIDTFDRGLGRRYTDAVLANGNKPATARRELVLVTAVCNHARKEGRTKHEFKLWKPEPGPSRLEVLDEDQERRLLAVPKPRRLQLFLYLGLNTGARAEAIEQLTWDRVDFEARTIDYRVPGVKYRNKRRVVVPMNDTLFRRLRSAKEYTDAFRPNDPYVIGTGPRGRCSTTYHGIAACYKAIGLKVSAPRHILRHTVATRLLRKRVPIAEVAQLLGDKVAMVEKVYSHMIPSDLMQAVNGL